VFYTQLQNLSYFKIKTQIILHIIFWLIPHFI
jgi:hypothetical protein